MIEYWFWEIILLLLHILGSRFCYDCTPILRNRQILLPIAHWFWRTRQSLLPIAHQFWRNRQILLPIAHCDWSKQVLLWYPQQILLLSIATFSTIGSVCILKLLSLLGSTRSWGQGIGEELDNGSMGVFIVWRRSNVISIQESCHTMPQKLAVTIWPSVIQCLQECGRSIYDAHLGSRKCICDLWVDGEEPWPSTCVRAPVTVKQTHHITNKIVAEQIIVHCRQSFWFQQENSNRSSFLHQAREQL